MRSGELIAFVGAGGKTSAAWRLLHLLVATGERVIFTTTTRIFEPKDVPLLLSPGPEAADVVRALSISPLLVVAAARGEVGDPERAAQSPFPVHSAKLIGLSPRVLSDLAQRLPGVTWLVEADGAKGHELKAPAEYEPVIPPGTDRVVVVAGLEALGRPLDERTVHRPQLAARLLGVPLGTSITPEIVAKLVSHASGGLKGVPACATVIALLTQQGDHPHPQATTIARQLLLGGRISRAVLANLRARDPVLGVWE